MSEWTEPRKRHAKSAEADELEGLVATRCGNRLHPDGQWHPATPLPMSWRLVERFKQALRRRRYGCGCAVGQGGEGE